MSCRQPAPPLIGIYMASCHADTQHAANTMSDFRTTDNITAWWQTSTQKDIQRGYDAETVLAMRDLYPEAINGPALKLRKILAAHQRAGTSTLASSCTDAVSLQMMAEAGLGTCP